MIFTLESFENGYPVPCDDSVSDIRPLAKKMNALKEGEGTLFDNCIMMWGSGLEDGNRQRRENL